MADNEKLHTKTFLASDIQAEDGKREVVAVISTATVDQDNEVVLPNGLVKKDYSGIPVFFNHEYTGNIKAMPIGSVRWIKTTLHDDIPALISKAYISDKTDDAKNIFNLMQDKCIRGVSIGFKSLEESKPTQIELKKWSGAKNIIRKYEIKEWSITPFPCNEQSVALMVSKGYPQKYIDMLSSKSQAEEIVVNEVVNEIKKTEPKSEKEIIDIIGKCSAMNFIKIDTDKIIRRIFN